MPQRNLIDKLLRRDEAAYIQIIDKYSRLLWSVAYGVLGNSCGTEDAEECVSDVFFKLWQNPNAFSPQKSNLKNFLVMMTRSRAIDIYRKKSKALGTELSDRILDLDSDPVNAVLSSEEKDELSAALSRLSDEDNEIILRRYIRDEKPAEISAQMNLPVRKVENRLYRAKQNLRASLQGGAICGTQNSQE